MCFQGNQLLEAIKHPFISLCFEYYSPGFICFSTMLAPVIPSLDEIYCISIRISQLSTNALHLFPYLAFTGRNETMRSLIMHIYLSFSLSITSATSWTTWHPNVSASQVISSAGRWSTQEIPDDANVANSNGATAHWVTTSVTRNDFSRPTRADNQWERHVNSEETLSHRKCHP